MSKLMPLATSASGSQLNEMLDKLSPYLFKPITLIPKPLSEHLITSLLNKLFSQAIVEEELAFLQGNWLNLTIRNSNFSCFITYIDEANPHLIGTLQLPEHIDQAQVTFSADIQSLILLANKKVDPDTLFFQRRLLVTGDTELGLSIKNFIDDYDYYQAFSTPVQNLLKRLSQALR